MSKNPITKRIAQLANSQRFLLIEQYEQFEKDGFIGDCELRDLAEELRGYGPVTFCMREIAFELYRFYAKQSLSQLNWMRDCG